jgi:hypothetical protein
MADDRPAGVRTTSLREEAPLPVALRLKQAQGSQQ